MPQRRSRLFSWLDTWRPDELQGTLTDIFIAPAAGAPMQRLVACRCLPGVGLEGDRYALGSGHWIKTDACEVTLLTREDLKDAARRSAVPLADGEHRRNLVIDGIPLAALRRHRLRIGGVGFAFHRLRPPCGYLDRVAGPGVGRALGKGAGIGLRVLDGGTIRVGDRVEVLVDGDG